MKALTKVGAFFFQWAADSGRSHPERSEGSLSWSRRSFASLSMTLVALSIPSACLMVGDQPSSRLALSDVYGFPPRQYRTALPIEPG